MRFSREGLGLFCLPLEALRASRKSIGYSVLWGVGPEEGTPGTSCDLGHRIHPTKKKPKRQAAPILFSVRGFHIAGSPRLYKHSETDETVNCLLKYLIS